MATKIEFAAGNIGKYNHVNFYCNIFPIFWVKYVKRATSDKKPKLTFEIGWLIWQAGMCITFEKKRK